MATNLYKGVDAQADLARRRASQTEQSQVGMQRDAMNRRAAQMGGGPGGAMVKQERIMGDESAQRLQQANEGIEAARMGEHSRIAGVLQGQQFARGERLGTQKWQSGEANLQRGWQTGEREAGQTWQTGERLGAQTWQTGERGAAQKWQTSERRGAQVFTADENSKNRNELARQFDAEEAMAKWVNKANTILSANNSGLSAEALSGLFEALGINIGDIPGLTAPKSGLSGGGGSGTASSSGPTAPASGQKPPPPMTSSGAPATGRYVNQNGQWVWQSG